MISQWKRGLRDLGQDLTNIEVNTIVTDSISGRKMPTYPHALLDIAQKYADYLTGPDVGLDLDQFARSFCNGPGDSDKDIDHVTAPRDQQGRAVNFNDRVAERKKAKQKENGETSHLEQRLAFMREVKPSFQPTGTHYSFRLTNGWETFELLRWAANNTLATTYKWRDDQAAGPKAPSPVKTEAARSIIFRILRNSDQLKVVADDLRELEGDQRFIGLTRRDLVNLHEVPKPAPPHDLTRIRKAWDIGTDRIVYQTVLQLDGDIILRASEKYMTAAENPLIQAHEKALATGIEYWHRLFSLIWSLITEKIGELFNPDLDEAEDKK